MSRLYMRARSDTRGTEVTSTGHEFLEFEIYYGSARDSVKLAVVTVRWPKGTDRPTIEVTERNE